MAANSERRRLATAISSSVPRSSGVYVFYDRHGRTIYIGKSVNLRQRILSYFGSNQSDLEYRTRQMIFSIRDFHFYETQSELLALLLEDTLIKREMPPYNLRQREYAEYCYLVLTNDAYQTCKIVPHDADSQGTAFGPFHNRYRAADVIGVLNHHFHLRSCIDPQPSRKCLNYELGFCTGPCQNKVSEAEYAVIVARAREFLAGDDRWITRKLRREMKKFSSALDYEKANGRKEELQFCRVFCAGQRFIRKFRTGKMTLRDNNGLTYRFIRGELASATAPGTDNEGASDLPSELLLPLNDPRFILDRAEVVYGWLNRHQDNSVLMFCDGL